MLLIPFDISSLTSHTWELYAPEMATKSKLSTWPESKKKMWKKKKSRVWYVLSRQVDFMSIHCIICVFKLIIRHWSNIRKWGERGAKASNQNPREKKTLNKSQQNQQVWASFGVGFGCIAYEILMWYLAERQHITGRNGWKSREKWKWFSLFFLAYGLQLSKHHQYQSVFTVFAHMNSLWNFVMMSKSMHRQTPWFVVVSANISNTSIRPLSFLLPHYT